MTAGKYQSTKTFRNLPCAHRRWRHEGHCAHIHGYSRTVTFWFEASERTPEGFVMDFGGLKPVKAWLEHMFDHTLLLDSDDPLLPKFRELEALGACALRVWDDVGMEGSARMIHDHVSAMIHELEGGRVRIAKVEVRENDKNSASYAV